MLGFNDWLKNQFNVRKPVDLQPEVEQEKVDNQEVETPPVAEDTVLPDISDKPEETESEKDESRPYTRALRNYPTLAPPTGGGPNFMYIGTDAQASAKAGGRNVSAEPFPGQSDKDIEANVKKWRALSGVIDYKSGTSKKS